MIINEMNNFCRVFELPDEFPTGFCFGGGYPVTFKMIDWFNPISPTELNENIKWEDYISGIKEFMLEKKYIKVGKKYLLITDFGEVLFISK
jgi:hypothetical protein